MDGACSTDGGQDACIQDCGQEPEVMRPFWKIGHKWDTIY